MTSDAGDSLRQAKAIDISSRTRTYRNRVGGSDPNDFFQFRLTQRSSLNLQLGRLRHNADVELIQDANSNYRIDPGERLVSAAAIGRTPERIARDRLEPGTYYIRVFSQESRRRSYRLSLSAAPLSAADPGAGSVPVGNWSAQFLDRTPTNVTDYGSYDFSKANAVRDLGGQGRQGKTIARLQLDYGDGSPVGIQPDHFAMQAWTRIDLEAGKFYQLTSDSDDGTRFLFKDRQTGTTLTELNGSWQHRNLQAPAWTQLLSAPQSGQYDFYVQYYDNLGKANVSVTLAEVTPTGQVVASQLNLRSQPSTQGNLPIASLGFGDRFTVVQKVRSADPANPEWFEVVTADNQRGYLAADRSFVEVGSGALTIGVQKTDTVPPIGGGSSFPIAGKISRKVLLTSDQQIAFRSGKDTSFGLIDRLTVNTPLTVLEKVTGGRYGNGFDQWYRVRVNQSGQEQEGYVAAYYVDVSTSDGKYQTAISQTNPLYTPHLNEATTPRYYSSSYQPMIEAAAAKYAWLKPSVIAGIGSRESAWGLVLSTPGPTGTGDGGHGRGLMQIDDRYHQDFIRSGRWRDPRESIFYAVDRVLRPNYDYLDRNTNLQGIELLRGAIAAYNSGLTNVMNAVRQGRDVDHYTTGRDYSWDVLNRAGWFQLNGWA